MHKKELLNVWVIICVSAVASAGQVYLTNGDRLTGTIAQMTDGMLTIESELAGTIQILFANIRTIASDQPLKIHTSEGTVTARPVSEGEDGYINVSGDRVLLADVTAINPPKPEAPRWKGDLSAGITYASGNTKNESYAFSGKLYKKTDKDMTTLKADMARQKEQSSSSGKKEVTEDWSKFRAKYDYFLSDVTYLYGESRYEKDKIADLDQRIILGGGLGRKWIVSEKTNFSTELGLATVREKYEDGSDSTMSARAGYNFDHTFNDTFSFMHDLTYYPSTEDVSDYYLSSSAELRAKINSHLFTNFKVLFDYDATPAAGKGNSDVKYIFGAGVNF